jgi:nitrogen-specific signal transduction histidine kinase
MDKKLVFSVCHFMLPEISTVIKNGNYPDVELSGFMTNCLTHKNRCSDLSSLNLKAHQVNSDIIIIGGHCTSPAGEKNNFPENIKTICLQQCAEMFLNRETVMHYISKGYYIVTNGWLQRYKQNMASWGFEKETAKVYFREAMRKILVLDTQIPGDYLPGLKAISEYMGLDYEILPVGLTNCNFIIDAQVNKWRNEITREYFNGKIAEVTKQSADISLVFNELENLVKITDENKIINLGLNLMLLLFAPAKVRFIQHLENETHIFESIGQKSTAQINESNSFDIEVKFTNTLIGVFEVIGVRFQKYMVEYKKMGVVISQIFGLSISNARKYQIILDQSKVLENYSEELQKINQSKDKFFSIIAHDLKGPFHSLIGTSDLLIDEIQNGSAENVKKLGANILNTSTQTFTLLENLLEWSRSQTGVIDFQPTELQLSDIIKDLFDLLQNQADKKNILLVNAIHANLTVFADFNMLTTVIRNLVSNAIKFTHPHGTITVSASHENRKTTVSVKDTGVGIPSPNLSKLFNIDNSLSTVGTAKEKGTGLGLILCREFVKKHHGEIRAESNPGKGSIFYFTLPDKTQ